MDLRSRADYLFRLGSISTDTDKLWLLPSRLGFVRSAKENFARTVGE